MAKDPAVLFYTADFMIGTNTFTNEQVGMYIRLLCHQHQNGRFKREHMAIICGSVDEEVLQKFNKDKDGNYYNIRMEEEAKKRSSFCKSRKDNAQKGKECQRKKPKAYADHMVNENEDVNEDINTNKIVEAKPQNIIPPTPEMVTEYCHQRGYGVDPGQFYDFYTAKGWKVGKEKMKDWQACCRTWEKRAEIKEKKGGSFIGILSDLYENE